MIKGIAVGGYPVCNWGSTNHLMRISHCSQVVSYPGAEAPGPKARRNASDAPVGLPGSHQEKGLIKGAMN